MSLFLFDLSKSYQMNNWAIGFNLFN